MSASIHYHLDVELHMMFLLENLMENGTSDEGGLCTIILSFKTSEGGYASIE